MSEFKMEHVFNKLKAKGGRNIDTADIVDEYGNWWGTFNGMQSAIYAAEAVNSYDRNQELIAKLQDDNELLREALESMDHVLSGYENPPAKVKEAISKMNKALAATDKG